MLAVLFLIYAYAYVDRLVISLLVTDIKASVGLDDTAMGLVMGPVPTPVFAVASFLAGWAADQFSRQLVLVCGMALFAAPAGSPPCCSRGRWPPWGRRPSSRRPIG